MGRYFASGDAVRNPGGRDFDSDRDLRRGFGIQPLRLLYGQEKRAQEKQNLHESEFGTEKKSIGSINHVTSENSGDDRNGG